MAQWTRFPRDNSGNIALMFGILVAPLLGMVGFMIDYSRATSARVFLQSSVDLAVLRVVSDPLIEKDDRTDAIRKVLAARLAGKGNLPLDRLKVTNQDGTVGVAATTSIRNVFSQIFGYERSHVSVNALASTGGKEAEVALVLDLTGSMRDDMGALRSSATELVDLLIPPGSTGVSVSVVPYVAAVNPGPSALASNVIDVAGQSTWHAIGLKSKGIAAIPGCTESWTSGNPPPRDPGAPTGNDRRGGLLEDIGSFASALFGVTAAHAEITPSTTEPLSGTTIHVMPSPDSTPIDAFLPSGFRHFSPCWLMNPRNISHADLFDRIPNVSWKGCVEARPEPFDVTDSVPETGNPDTLYVPYFWPDEPDKYESWVADYANNYMPDGVVPEDWEFENSWQRHYSILKYDTVELANVDDAPPVTLGPNAGCPDEIMPLSRDRDAIIGKINNLNHWEGGGTITSEGIAWGWRTISPNRPFDEAKAYGQAEKIMIVMSDGKNSLVANDPGGSAVSDYSAYGYLRSARFSPQTFAHAEGYLNDRMALVCENVKAVGITMYTVLFREVDVSARRLMADCASSPGKAFYAASQEDLHAAFKKIGENIGQIRLMK